MFQSRFVLKLCSAAAVCLLSFAAPAVRAQAPVRATTQDGRQVILNADGTWRYAAEAPPASAPASAAFKRRASATSRIKPPIGDFAFWIDPAKWKQSKEDEPGVL